MTRSIRDAALLLLLAVALSPSAHTESPAKGTPRSTRRSARRREAIAAADLLAHIKVLASDEFEGRGAGHAGRREDGRVSDRAVPQARPEARQPRRHLRPGRAARRLPGRSRRGSFTRRRRHDRPEVPATTASPSRGASRRR